MHRSSQYALIAGLASLLALSPLAAQSPTADDPSDRFDSENAIMDTSLPFAIGAQEARQSLRGSFGWPTFQEGLVEGVYFRFDPDGYARFSPAPRLDTDVFEVICRPRTYNCMGRKGALGMFLNARGQLQLRIEGIAEGDTFYISEGVTEIELPQRILQPLDTRFEALLMAGGELVVRRGGEEFERISLIGFSAVATYLRWVMARQDYTILPRGWPVPNSRANGAGGITQAASWQSPMPQPQVLAPAARLSDTGLPPALQAVTSQNEELVEVRNELSMLRALLEEEAQPNAAGSIGAAAVPQAGPAIGSTLHVPLGEAGALEERIARLEGTVAALESLLANSAPRAMGASALVADPLAPPTDMGAAGEAAAFGAAAEAEEVEGRVHAAPSARLEDFLGQSTAVSPVVPARDLPGEADLRALSLTLQTAYDVPPDVAQMVIALISAPATRDLPQAPPAPEAAFPGGITGDPFSVAGASTPAAVGSEADKEMIDLFRTREVDRILSELEAGLPESATADAASIQSGSGTPLSLSGLPTITPGAPGALPMDSRGSAAGLDVSVSGSDLQDYLTLSAYFKSVMK